MQGKCRDQPSLDKLNISYFKTTEMKITPSHTQPYIYAKHVSFPSSIACTRHIILTPHLFLLQSINCSTPEEHFNTAQCYMQRLTLFNFVRETEYDHENINADIRYQTGIRTVSLPNESLKCRIAKE